MAGKKKKPLDRGPKPHVRYPRARADAARKPLKAAESDPARRADATVIYGVPTGLMEALNRQIDELREQRLASDRRFEELRADMNARFEAVDQRFETMVERFEAMDKRFEAMVERFEAMDKRFEATVERLAAIDKRFLATEGRLDALTGRLDLAIYQTSQFTERAGHYLEDVVAGALRFALGRPDIRRDQIRLRQHWMDKEGRFGRKGRRAELDVVAADGKTYLIEVKAFARRNDVEDLVDRADFAAKMLGLAPGAFEVVLVTLGKNDIVIAACKDHGVTLL